MVTLVASYFRSYYATIDSKHLNFFGLHWFNYFELELMRTGFLKDNRKMKVLIYTDCYIYGGSERLMSFLLRNKKINEEFDLVFAFRNHKEYKKGLLNDFKNLKIKINPHPLFVLSNATLFYKLNSLKLSQLIKKIIKLPFFILQVSGLYFLFNFFSFIFFIKKINPEIIHVNNGGYPGASSCNHFVFASRFINLNSIVYQINNIAFPTTNSLRLLYDKLINRYVKYFITASAKAGIALIENRNFSQEKIVQIPNTILLEKLTAKKEDILKIYKWDDDIFLLVQVAFLTNRKGQFYLLNAINEIRKQSIPDLSEKIKLILVGNGEDEPILRKYVIENNLDDTIIFAGYKADSVNYINACDVFVLPSIANEDMPLSLLTAMSLGKPIVATHFAGIAEAIINKKSGLLLDPKTECLSANLSTSIIELYKNPALRLKLANNARLTFNNKYSEDIYAQRIINLYNLSLS
jgi:glycosyltransferase involved in cell wall biosynthesis